MNVALWPLRMNVVSANAARPRGAGSATGETAGSSRSVVTAMGATSFVPLLAVGTPRQGACNCAIPSGRFTKTRLRLYLPGPPPMRPPQRVKSCGPAGPQDLTAADSMVGPSIEGSAIRDVRDLRHRRNSGHGFEAVMHR